MLGRLVIARGCAQRPLVPVVSPFICFEGRTGVHDSFEVTGALSEGIGGNEVGRLLVWYACHAAAPVIRAWGPYCPHRTLYTVLFGTH